LLKAKAPLKIGARGQVVLDVQNRLKAKGFDVGTPDGGFGKRTKAAVITLQKSYQLYADGIVGPKTWMVLQTLKPPNPIINPPQPTPIQFVDVCRSYRQQPHQDEALNWLQQQLPKPILDEFTQAWRQVTDTSTMNPTPLSFINVCKSYKALSHQDTAINRLQNQISPTTLNEFARRWRLK
jgi:lysozyme